MNFLNNLREKTHSGQITWEYDSHNRQVTYTHNKFEIQIKYYFDHDIEVPYFYVYYFDRVMGKDYVFNSNKYEDEFRYIENLYHLAQSSNFMPPDF